jgi:dGTPase
MAEDVVKREVGGRVTLSPDLFEAGLSPLAQRSSGSRGRERPEEPCRLRTPYQRDRDRIVHCKSFRRLKHKTQVFIAPEGDHLRTRLTHTLETSGVARAVARALRLNEDLAEAVAMGHDLGHTPFGHAGEEALDAVLREMGRGSFHHNEQSLRVVDVVEHEGWGLNLTWEVRDGILNHTGPGRPATLEGRVVRLADRIAYINHDIDDALRAGLIVESDLPAGPVGLLGRTSSERIDRLVHDLVDASDASGDIVQSGPVGRAMDELRAFLFATVYERSIAQSDAEAIRRIVADLVTHFLSHPDLLPVGGRAVEDTAAPPVSRVVDHVAGMTDRYAQRVHQELVHSR